MTPLPVLVRRFHGRAAGDGSLRGRVLVFLLVFTFAMVFSGGGD